ncbi:MAG: fibronectin type III domain-containing protein [Lachnospiraceae bacterium]|nr:fibronectin type III domain-containing protein [Lachnospiraceae bacterium]
MKKRGLALLLIMAMTLSLLAPMGQVSKVSAAEAGEITNSVGEFYYASEQYTAKDYPATYYYSDGYFSETAYNYQDSLATMSMCLALSAFRSNRADSYSEKPQNLKALLKACGFTNFAANSYFTSKPERDSTGIGCAYKKIKANGKTCTLVVLAVSGGRYEAEWGGCYEIGESGEAAYIRYGADTALSYLKKYLADENITGDIKLWTTSYGIGAGKVNLLASDLDDGASLGSNITLKPENLYAYCFESIQSGLENYGLDDGIYRNIFCVNNPCDFVTYMAPSEYGFGNFGVIKEFPSPNGGSQYSTKRKAMLKKLANLDGSDDYVIDDFQMMKISILGDGMVAPDTSKNWDQAQFSEAFVKDIIKASAPDRKDYVNKFESDMCDLMALLFGNPDANWMDCLYYFVNLVNDNILPVGLNIVLANESKLVSLYKEYAFEALERSHITNMTDADVTKFAEVLARLAIEFGREYPNETVTLFYNLPSLFQAYFPPVNLAWLQSVDGNYNGVGRDITKCDASLSKTSYNYDGKSKKPSVKVTNGGVILTNGTDYTVSYANNKNAGTATATIKGTGLYEGTIKKSFKINKVSNTITASSTTKTYSSKDKSFSLGAKAKGSAKLSYKSNNSNIKVSSSGKVTIKKKYIGKATITITSAETTNYKKTSKKITVTVKPTKTTLDSVKSNKSKSLTIKWKKNTSASGYQIYLSRTKDFSKDTKSLTIKKQSTVSMTITGLDGGKTYYVKIRGYKTVKDVKYYGSWSSTKSNKTKK